MMHRIDIGENEAPQRVDRFLCKYFNNAPRTVVFRLLRKKLVRVNGKRLKENTMLQCGDLLTLHLSDAHVEEMKKPERVIKPSALGLKIIYEDDDILVLDKPVGLLTHPDKTEFKNTLATRVLEYLSACSSRTFRPAPIQRLDKNTSGLVLFAKNYHSLQYYNECMRDRKIAKKYLAIVKGRVDRPGEIRGYLEKDASRNRVRILDHETETAKSIYTSYAPLEVCAPYSLVEVTLQTGRSHQIRASLESIGFPIVGDQKYGGGNFARQSIQLLHAYMLVLPDGRVIQSPAERIYEFWNEHKK